MLNKDPICLSKVSIKLRCLYNRKTSKAVPQFFNYTIQDTNNSHVIYILCNFRALKCSFLFMIIWLSIKQSRKKSFLQHNIFEEKVRNGQRFLDIFQYFCQIFREVHYEDVKIVDLKSCETHSKTIDHREVSATFFYGMKYIQKSYKNNNPTSCNCKIFYFRSQI